MPLYRLYLDESGTHSYSVSDAVDKRYLCIIGVVVSENEIANKLQPYIKALKDIIRKDPDETIILHREEIANRTGVFGRLKDPALEKAWNEQIVRIIRDVDFRVCAVVLDKKDHKAKYTSPMHPYHYCVHMLVERYVKYLEKRGNECRGDVMAEARGEDEDEALQSEYTNVYETGTYYVDASRFQARLTGKDIKMTPKFKAVSGLELADLLVLASKLDVLKENGHINKINSKFTAVLINELQSKYDRNGNGALNGYGKKFLGGRK